MECAASGVGTLPKKKPTIDDSSLGAKKNRGRCSPRRMSNHFLAMFESCVVLPSMIVEKLLIEASLKALRHNSGCKTVVKTGGVYYCSKRDSGRKEGHVMTLVLMCITAVTEFSSANGVWCRSQTSYVRDRQPESSFSGKW